MMTPAAHFERLSGRTQRRRLSIAVLFFLATIAVQAQSITVYNNSTTFTGTFSNGGAADNNAAPGVAITKLVADDIHVDPASAGLSLANFSVSIANTDPSAAFSARLRVRFWLADGAVVNGVPTPGTFVAGFTFDPATFAASSHNFVFGTIAPGVFVLPANGIFWAGITFDNGTQNALTSSATTAQLNELGGGLFNPPSIGSSVDEAFATNSAGSFFGTNNPSGTVFVSPFGGNPVANLGWQFQVYPVPEPSTWSMFAVGAGFLGAFALRRARLSPRIPAEEV